MKAKLRGLLVCSVLLFGSMSGLQMPPEEIEELMHSMNQQKIVCVVTKETADGRKED